MKIAVVIQRFGKEITGGSESLCRDTLRRLAQKHSITVYTSTALDYVTWRRHYREGLEEEDGIAVRRFAPERERRLESFNRLSDWIYANDHSDEDEARWLQEQGPHCPELVEAIRAEQDRYDLFLFYTYLYYPTVAGLRVVDKPVIMVPTAHREPPAALRMYRSVFRRPEGLVFNTHAEERFVADYYKPSAKHRAVAGIGITIPSRVAARSRVARPGILYAGRIDAGKGCEELVEYFVRFRAQYMPCRLYFMGSLNMRLVKHPEIEYLGFVSEDEKFASYRDASVVVIPSRFESLSIVALESLAVGTPLLVNGACDVLRDHCIRGNAGLFYRDFDEFGETLSMMLRHRDLAGQLGAFGRRYVLNNYTWDKVLARYENMFQRVARA